jgi:anti-sigma factor RsiW
MNCEKCQELLSELLDGSLPAAQRTAVVAHLECCRGCAAVRDELSAIVGVAHDSRDFFVSPPNERALWLRIRNSIETEAPPAAAAAAAAPPRAGLGARLSGWRMSLSLPQLVTAAAGLAVSVALVTALGMRALIDAREQSAAEARRPAARRLQKPDDLLRVEYLKQRVEERRARWNPRTREAFDQNLSVIDLTVNEMLRELDERPHDEVTEQALNAAMRDKMELLKEFSEL